MTRARVGFRARVTDIELGCQGTDINSAQRMLGMQVKGIPSLNTDTDDLYDILSRAALVKYCLSDGTSGFVIVVVVVLIFEKRTRLVFGNKTFNGVGLSCINC